MNKYLIPFLLITVSLLNSCRDSPSLSEKNASDVKLSDTSCLVHFRNISTLDNKVLLEDLVTTCKKYGNVKLIEENKPQSNEGILIDLVVQRISEGDALNIGKELPVLSVNLNFMDYSVSENYPSYESFTQFVEWTDKPETAETVSKIMNTLLNQFETYYRNQHPMSKILTFNIEEPLIL